MSKDLEIPFDPSTAQAPAILVNRTTVFASGGIVRFTFGEGFPGALPDGRPLYAWRMSCAMTLDDALEVAEVILQIVSEQKRRIAALGASVNEEGVVTPQGSA